MSFYTFSQAIKALGGQKNLFFFTTKCRKSIIAITITALAMLLNGCSQQKSTPLFTAVNSATSGINFINQITETDQLNLISNEYSYMGGGVGAGDFNNDGLQDLFFTANQTSCKLYINKGSFTFKDVTDSSGIKTNQWCTGVSVADINNDGWQDVYISVSGPVPAEKRKNLLYINNHNLTFTESAAAYGLDDTSHSTQAVFLDYDNDGFTDMFLLTHQMQGESMNKVLPKVLDGSSPRNDRLFHNEGIDNKTGHPTFKNVTMQAGIRDDGYGLGVVVSDFNNDCKPDIYVANDYIGNDCLWINNGNGTFTNTIATSLNHQSYSSMGTDAADINNDGLPDIATLDMMPEDNQRKKMMYSILSNERHEMEKYFHYEPSYMHNTLQLNRGAATINDTLVTLFSDIANFASVAETDWSWSVLAADFTNDGLKDLHITNGMGRDMINSDFVAYRSSAPPAFDRNKMLLQQLNTLGSVPLPNYFFQNNGDYTFTNASASAGINEKAISNGACYADLDNDGDLDIVVNNINTTAFVFENQTANAAKKSAHYLELKLNGSNKNRDGFGTIIKLYTGDSTILLEQNPVRGYLSTVDKRLFAGLGSKSAIDSIQVIWPDQRMQLLKNIKANQTLEIDYKNADQTWKPIAAKQTLFENNTKNSGINFTHNDPFFFDYDFQRLLPQKFSSQGPGIAVGDVNNDGLEDFYAGNGYHVKGLLFIQKQGGSFTSKYIDAEEKFEEDAGAVFFDADGDGDQDLLVTSGTNEFAKNSKYYLPRLYLNDGTGNFSRNLKAIPETLTTVSCVVKICDYDNDGDTDLFIGGRIASGNYPAPPPSYLLQNNKGIFTDVTGTICPALSNAGMITDAAFADIDGDKLADLVICGEWMPLRIFKNNKNKLTEIVATNDLANAIGLWRAIDVADADNDGDLDIVAGNIGINNKFHFNQKYPLNLWYSDMDGNGIADPVFGYYIVNETGQKLLYPSQGLDEIAAQVPLVKKKYLLHQNFSTATMEQLFENFTPPAKLIANEAASCIFKNDGKGSFTKFVLPAEAQFAPVNCILINDYNQDGINDILFAGNEYETEVMTGRYDASYGLLLTGNKQGTFVPVPQNKSGFIVRGDTRCMRHIAINKKNSILAAVNSGQLQVFQIRN